MLIQKQIIQGDSKALGKIYQIHFPKVFRVCMSYVKNETVAADLVQEVFLKLWRNREKISLEVPLEQQLFQITKNIVFDHLRKQALEAKLLMQYDPSSITTEAADRKEKRLREIDALIKKLPQKQRQVLEMAKFHGLTYEEIAKELGISKYTVSNHFSAAMKFLRSRTHLLSHGVLLLMIAL